MTVGQGEGRSHLAPQHQEDEHPLHLALKTSEADLRELLKSAEFNSGYLKNQWD